MGYGREEMKKGKKTEKIKEVKKQANKRQEEMKKGKRKERTHQK
jgi:hypothetical protein